MSDQHQRNLRHRPTVLLSQLRATNSKQNTDRCRYSSLPVSSYAWHEHQQVNVNKIEVPVTFVSTLVPRVSYHDEWQ